MAMPVCPLEPTASAVPVVQQPGAAYAAAMWLGSVGYEGHRDARAFARGLRAAGVERLIDVRELPNSRRRDFAKRNLAEAMAKAGIEYWHVKALGNPKPYRELYKAGHIEEGRRRYERHLVLERAQALRDLLPLLAEKRSALMCVEREAAVCHRAVIIAALREQLGVELDVLELA